MDTGVKKLILAAVSALVIGASVTTISHAGDVGKTALGACPSNIRKDAILKFYCPICGCRDAIFPQRGFK